MVDIQLGSRYTSKKIGIRFMWMIFLLNTFKILLNKCCWSSQNTEIIKDKSFLKYFFKCLFSWINHWGTFQQGKACSIPAVKTIVAFCIWTRNKWQIVVSSRNESRHQGKFVTTVYRKPTFSDVYTHFDSFFCQRLIIKRPQLTTVKKKTLILLIPYLGNISLQTTKLRKSFKCIFELI